MMLILLMAAAVSCSNPMLQQPSGGMPDGLEFCNQGRLKKLCQKGVLQQSTTDKPVAMSFCPGTLKKLCPIKPVALQFSSGPVSSVPVGWKICRDNLGLCPANSRAGRPKVRASYYFPKDSRVGRPNARPSYYNPTESRLGRPNVRPSYYFPKDSRVGRPNARPSYYRPSASKPAVVSRVGRPSKTPITFPVTFIGPYVVGHNLGMVPCKDRMGMCDPETDLSSFLETRVMTHNKGMVPCKDKMDMCPESDTDHDDDNDNDDTNNDDENDNVDSKIIYPESQPISFNEGMVPCKDRMGMCFPEN